MVAEVIRPEDEIEVGLEELVKLRREVWAIARDFGRKEARGLVELYYRWQDHRKALDDQARAAKTAERPTELVQHFADQVRNLERQMVGVLGAWTDGYVVGRWSKLQKGIGPILAAGLLAHIDIERAKTAGAIWRFAGLEPTVKWEKGHKRPWNAELKVICWRIGDSFVKVSGREDAFYGQVYRERKKLEEERNRSGQFADQAQASKDSGRRLTENQMIYYANDLLPPGRLDLRARRVAVKLFLSHWHEVAYRAHYGEDPPVPYVVATSEGRHSYIPPPHMDEVL